MRLKGKGWAPGKARLVMNANVHARKWIARMASLNVLENLVDRMEADSSFLASTDIVFLPLFHPVGFVEITKGNRFHLKSMARACVRVWSMLAQSSIRA
jgi:hypothetical protein